jgi:hypothetical protein
MDDTPCQRFFLEPLQPLHRRYAALRAFFVENLPLPTLADRFGVTYHTVRSWVRDFRAQCQAGQIPPFSPSRVWADRPAKAFPSSRRDSKNRPPRMVVN